MEYFMPTIGVSGLYRLLPPFSNALQADTAYRCEAIRRLADVSASGVDAYEQIYQPAGITEEKYQEDVAKGVCLVSLVADGGAPVYVPNSYISGAPDIGGVPYRRLILSFDLAMLPDSVNLSALTSKLQSDILDIVGVTSQAKTIVASLPLVISAEQHAVVEATRQSRITNSTTDYQRYVQMKQAYDRLMLRYQEVEAYLIANHIEAP